MCFIETAYFAQTLLHVLIRAGTYYQKLIESLRDNLPHYSYEMGIYSNILNTYHVKIY